MRDINKIAEAGNKKVKANIRRDLRVTDYTQLLEESSLPGSDNLFELINKVFDIGFEQGYRARASKEKKNIA